MCWRLYRRQLVAYTLHPMYFLWRSLGLQEKILQTGIPDLFRLPSQLLRMRVQILFLSCRCAWESVLPTMHLVRRSVRDLWRHNLASHSSGLLERNCLLSLSQLSDTKSTTHKRILLSCWWFLSSVATRPDSRGCWRHQTAKAITTFATGRDRESCPKKRASIWGVPLKNFVWP